MNFAPCPACGGKRIPRKCLCFDCWWELPRETRVALMKHDSAAMARLRKLHEAMERGTALRTIRIEP